MKKALKTLIPIIILVIILFLFYKIKDKVDQKTHIKITTSYLPHIKYLNLYNDSIFLHSPSKKTKFLIFFNSECEHCINEINLMATKYQDFKNAEVYFFSNEPLEVIKKINDKYFKDKENYKIGKISHQVSSDVFGINTYPCIYIYSKNNAFLKSIKGEVKLEVLTKFINV